MPVPALLIFPRRCALLQVRAQSTPYPARVLGPPCDHMCTVYSMIQKTDAESNPVLSS